MSPSSFYTLEPGTPVRDRFGLPVGTVERVMIAFGEYFDGILVATRVGSRFVDAPEVERITAKSVTLSIGCHDVEHPGEPRVHGAHAARIETATGLSEDDRTALIEALKLAYVHDQIDADELAAAVERAHRAERPGDLDGLV